MTSPKQHRRDVFSRVKQSVLALAYLKMEPAELAKAPIQELSKHVQIKGSAFIVDDTGIAATAHHVIQRWVDSTNEWKKKGGPVPRPLFYLTHTTSLGDPEEGRAGLHIGRIIDAVVSSNRDLALLRLQEVAGYAPRALPLALDLYEEGDEVAICGFPFGLELHQDQQRGAIVTASFTTGTVSAVLPRPGAPEKYRTVFQVAAMISGGNSGGPVFDPSSAEVLGVVTSSIETEHLLRVEEGTRDAATGVTGNWQQNQEVDIAIPSGIARAVPIHLIRAVIEDFKARTAEKVGPLRQVNP